MEESYVAHIRKTDHAVQTLFDHLVESSSIAGNNADKIGLKETGEILGLLHDMGKASNKFQNYILSANGVIDPDCDEYTDSIEYKGKIDHSSAGAQLAYHILEKHGKRGEIAGQLLALCLASHHSGLIDCLSPDGENVLRRRIEKSNELTNFCEVSSRLKHFYESKINDQFLQQVEDQLFKKIGSSIEKEPDGKILDSNETLSFKNGLLIRFLFSCLIDADRLSTADFESPSDEKIRNQGKYAAWDILIQRLNNKIFEFEEKKEKNLVDNIRNQISSSCLEISTRQKGIYQLNVPTGGGKTLASLRFALNHAKIHQMSHVFYIIPYTSIIDQNANEVRKILEERDSDGNSVDKVVLEHHSNLTPEEESHRHNLLAQNWDAPVIFTTQVQFLDTLFGHGTRDVRRLHQLANSVIIFDEIQTLPIRCVQMFNLAIRFLVHSCESTVVLCTATQPLLEKIKPVERALTLHADSKIITNEHDIYETLKRVEIIDKRKPGGWDDSEIAQLSIEQVHNMGSVLIIVNTKASARSLFLTLTQATDFAVFHLSTSMCPVHRLQVLNEVRKKLKAHEPVICVSTQLIEAGVDIDFGCVVRYLAGLDSIVQAAGRCNRNGRQNELGKVFVVNPSNESLNHLKDIQSGVQVTARVWNEYQDNPTSFDNDMIGLQAMSKYYQYYFFEHNSEMNFPIEKNSIIGREDDVFSLLSTNTKSYQEYLRGRREDLPVIHFTQAFASAARCFSVIDQVTRGIVVPYEKEGEELVNDLCSSQFLEKQYGLLRKAQHFSVNLYPNEFEEMLGKKAINEVQKGAGIYFLDQQFYHVKFGWSNEAVETMKTLICEGGKFGK